MTQTSVPAQPCPACSGSGQLPPTLIENSVTGLVTSVPQPCLACAPR